MSRKVLGKRGWKNSFNLFSFDFENFPPLSSAKQKKINHITLIKKIKRRDFLCLCKQKFYDKNVNKNVNIW